MLTLSAVILLAFDFVSGTDSLKLGFFDFLRLLLEHLVKSCHVLIELHDPYVIVSHIDSLTLEEIDALSLEVLRLTILLG